MRSDFAKEGGGLTYEIRYISEIADFLLSKGRKVYWENIGDPVLKGEKIPSWMKDILKSLLDDDSVYAYPPTKGIHSAREYLARKNNARGGAQITEEDIIFFNGLGDAVARTYSALQENARVLLPEPTYSTHYIAEAFHANTPPLTYRMNPDNGWRPDLAEMERKIREHKEIVGIMVVNPDNPTGYVYPEYELREIVRIAGENDLFLIFDEIYNTLVYHGYSTPLLSDIIGTGVAGISMKSISKEVPWPGGRCGWIEIYNSGIDTNFDKFIYTIYKQRMAEVCSVSLPQAALPLIFEHAGFKPSLDERISYYEELAETAYEELSKSKYITVNKVKGTFYMAVTFKDGVLNSKQTLPLPDRETEAFITARLDDKSEQDKRFAYYLLGATGICVVPLTAFFARMNGFRVILLEKDISVFKDLMGKLLKAVDDYIESA